MTDATPVEPDFSSVHTQTFATLLDKAPVSLLVTTYQAGKLIVVRGQDGAANTHFRIFPKPMGLACDGRRFALGVKNEVREFHNVPAAASKLQPPDCHDACFIPRWRHTTADVDIHEMAYDGHGTLWFVNTRFSCLCTLDHTHNFIPRWRPPFITGYSPDDRCHLNGLGMRDGMPRYVTMLGQSDTPGGWRDNKRDGGLVMDLRDNRVITRGLSMPHSPRWYRNTLWCLESGHGALVTLDPDTGAKTTVCELPGFTRGLSFLGDFAFIGLSQVRESAVFAGLPLTEREAERACGVWVVNITNGDTVAFLRFEGAVQEIFSVEVLPGIRFPDVLEDSDPLINTSYVLPTAALSDVDLDTIEARMQALADKSRPPATHHEEPGHD